MQNTPQSVANQINVWKKLRTNSFFKVFAFGLVMVLLVLVYFWEYNNSNGLDSRWNFLILKSITNTGVILVCLSQVLGPLARIWKYFQRWVGYRKALGVWGLICLTIHAYGSAYLYLVRIPTYLTLYWGSLLNGLAALLLFGVCVYISQSVVIASMGRVRWRRWLRILSYSGLILGMVHVMMLKQVEWRIYWTGARDGILPPISLVVFGMGLLILAIRFYVVILDVLSKKDKS
jgi:hypothetical protein